MGGDGHAEPLATSFEVTVDRGEGDQVILLVRKEGEATRIAFPRRLLPAGTHEGSVLRFTIEDRPDEEAAARGRVERLLGRLLQANRSGSAGPSSSPAGGLPDSGLLE